MNYYPHHIGDFDKATRHLTRIERSIYRDLLDVYYDTEAALTLDLVALCRKIIARTDEERTAVEQVLNEFFTKAADGWTHERCEEEIAAYSKKLDSASAAGKASAAKRAEKAARQANDASTTVERPLSDGATNQNQNQNQEPEEQKSGADIAQDAIEAASKSAKTTPAARSSGAQGSRLAADWALPDAWESWALAERVDWKPADIARVAASFRDYWLAKPGAPGRKADWEATWRNWVRRESESRPPAAGARSATPAQRQSDWNQRLKESLAAHQRPETVDMGVIDAAGNAI